MNTTGPRRCKTSVAGFALLWGGPLLWGSPLLWGGLPTAPILEQASGHAQIRAIDGWAGQETAHNRTVIDHGGSPASFITR